jgi:hypothetical protein
MEKWKRRAKRAKEKKIEKTWNGGVTTEEENQWHYGSVPPQAGSEENRKL